MIKNKSFFMKIESISKLPSVVILQKTFVSFSGILLVSSFLTLIQKFPIVGWQEFLGEKCIFALSKISSIGFNYISLFVLIAFCYYYFENHHEKMNHIPITLLNLGIFLVINVNEDGIDLTYLGARGVFGALLVTYVSMRIYSYFVEHKIYIQLPKEVPSVIADSFIAIVPTLLIILLWGCIVFIFDIHVLEIIELLFSPLMNLGDSFLAVIVIPLLNRLLWFVGIHGAAVINSIISPMMTVMNTTNFNDFCLGQPFTYLVSGNFYSVYVWIGVFPVTLALPDNEKQKKKAMGLTSLIPTFFNVDEPILFGIPIILNPILLIPHMLSGIIPAILSYFALQMNLIPMPVLSVPWTIPAPIKAFLATNNDIRALIWVLLLWILMYLIYLPFISKMKE